MNKNILFLLLCLVFLCKINPSDISNVTEKKSKIAILDFSYNEKIIDKQSVNDIVQLFISSFIKNSSYDVVESDKLTQVMDQLKFQSSDNFNDKTRKEIGNLSGADVVVLGNITKFGDVYTINIRGVNVETGIATFADTLTFKKIETLPSIISKFVANLNLTKNVDNIDLINLKYKIFKYVGTGILIPSSVIFSISFPLIMVGVGLFSYGDYIFKSHPEYYEADNYTLYQNESWYREAQNYLNAGFFMIIPNAVISSIQLIMGIVSIPILVHSVKLKNQIFGIEKLKIYPFISMNEDIRIGLKFSFF